MRVFCCTRRRRYRFIHRLRIVYYRRRCVQGARECWYVVVLGLMACGDVVRRYSSLYSEVTRTNPNTVLDLRDLRLWNSPRKCTYVIVGMQSAVFTHVICNDNKNNLFVYFFCRSYLLYFTTLPIHIYIFLFLFLSTFLITSDKLPRSQTLKTKIYFGQWRREKFLKQGLP